MKPPSSIKRGQRGARPGVPRKNRRQSLLQSQQSVNKGEGSNSFQKNTDEQMPMGPQVSSQYTIAPVPQFIASGTLKPSVQHMINQRTETAMGIAGTPLSSGNVAMLAGLPISSSNALHFDGTINRLSPTTGSSVVSSVPQSIAYSGKFSPKSVPRISVFENSSNYTVTLSQMSTPSNVPSGTLDTRGSEQDNNETAEVGMSPDSGDKSTITKQEKKTINDINDISNKAVHIGMPVTIPTYNANVKTKSKSLTNSLSKRRLMSSSGDGSTPKRFPRLILPKSIDSRDHEEKPGIKRANNQKTDSV